MSTRWRRPRARFSTAWARGFAVINADQPWASQWRKRAGAAPCWISAWNNRRLSAPAISDPGRGGSQFYRLDAGRGDAGALAVPGVHNVANALAAIAVGLACELPWRRFATGWTLCGRWPDDCVGAFTAGATVIDDCYNANPGSVRAAIDLLAAVPGGAPWCWERCENWARQRGPAPEVGEYARAAGIEQLWGVGPELQCSVQPLVPAAVFCRSCGAVAVLEVQFGSGDTVLVKGSRSAGMEQVLQALLADRDGRGLSMLLLLAEYLTQFESAFGCFSI